MPRKNTANLHDYPAEFAGCRVDRHAMGTAVWHAIGRNLSERVRQCGVCGLRITETIDVRRWERVEKRRYNYAPGFLRPRSGATREDYVHLHLANDFARAQGQA